MFCICKLGPTLNLISSVRVSRLNAFMLHRHHDQIDRYVALSIAWMLKHARDCVAELINVYPLKFVESVKV